MRGSDSRTPAQRDLRRTRRRLALLGGLGVALLLALLARIGWMQTAHSERFALLAEGNHLRSVPVPPPRGLIFDRRGELLADNRAQYGLTVVPAQAGDLGAVLAELRALIDIQDWERRAFEREARRSRHRGATLRLDLGAAELARVATALHRLPGVSLDAYSTRRYPRREALAHVLGHLTYIDEHDQERLDRRRYRGTRRIGRTGLERQYEALLLGRPGLQQAVVDSAGRTIRRRDRQPPVPGRNLHLTLDARLQQAAMEQLAGRAGAIVALEPATGDVLALVSAPGFDPELFGHRLSPRALRAITERPHQPLLNRAVQGRYPPGSTIKPLLALAGLEHGAADPGERFFAGPEFWLPGYSRPFRDWKEEGHGWVTLSSAIAQSCDVYFYTLAHRLGIDAIHGFLARFGLGAAQGLDLPGELPGLLPSPDWKRRALGEAWFPGETVITGIGQGYLLLTPLQLATAAAAIATRGVRMRPRLLRAHERGGAREEFPTEVAGTVALADPAGWQLVTDAMVEVMHGARGTGRRSGRNAAYRIAGKTGTVQVINYGEEIPEDDELPEHMRDHSMFIAFAPAEAPRIALAVVAEHGGAGSALAAPIARRLLDGYLLGDYP